MQREAFVHLPVCYHPRVEAEKLVGLLFPVPRLFSQGIEAEEAFSCHTHEIKWGAIRLWVPGKIAPPSSSPLLFCFGKGTEAEGEGRGVKTEHPLVSLVSKKKPVMQNIPYLEHFFFTCELLISSNFHFIESPWKNPRGHNSTLF